MLERDFTQRLISSKRTLPVLLTIIILLTVEEKRLREVKQLAQVGFRARSPSLCSLPRTRRSKNVCWKSVFPFQSLFLVKPRTPSQHPPCLMPWAALLRLQRWPRKGEAALNIRLIVPATVCQAVFSSRYPLWAVSWPSVPCPLGNGFSS